MTTTDEIMRLAQQYRLANLNTITNRFDSLRVAVSDLVAERDAMREELDITDKLLSEKARVLQRIPACPSHGDQCVPHAIEWIDAALSAPAVPQWIPVSERLPESGQIVLACYTNRAGNVRRIRAQWVAAKTSEYVGDGDFGEYDEATDTYYDPEGWYECIDNWDDYSAVMVREGDITDWQPLPAAPSAKEPQI